MHGRTLTLLMRDFKLLIFLWGHLMMLSSLHLFFNTVSPTFISLAALDIGKSKYFWISSNSSGAVLFLPLILLCSPYDPLEAPYSFWIILNVSLEPPSVTLLQYCPNEPTIVFCGFASTTVSSYSDWIRILFWSNKSKSPLKSKSLKSL